MGSWIRRAALGAVGALLATSAIAADHTDGSNSGQGVQANPAADINDVYAWSASGSNLALIMTVLPFAEDTAAFDTSTLYVFNVYRDGSLHLGPGGDFGGLPPAAGLTRIICKFAAQDDAECWVGENDYVKGDPSGTAGMTSANGTKVFAGLRHDPFFFDLGGFNSTVTAVRTAATGGLTYTDAGCPLLDDTTVGSLQGLLAGGDNTFAELNTLAIVIEVPKSALNGTGELFNIYASTHEEG